MTSPRRTGPRALATASVIVVGVVAAAASGCALLDPPSPTATVTDATGAEVTLSWADYPGEAHVDPADVLAAPRAERVEVVADVQLADVRAAIAEQVPGLSRDGREGGVYPHERNGYGGATLHRTLNSHELSSEAVPDDWPALVADIEAALAAHGYGPIEWDFDREPWGHETPAERDAEVEAQHGSLEPAEMWQWVGQARDGAMWVTVILVDVDRGVGAPAGAEPGAPQLLSLMVGGTVIAEGDAQAYRDGTAPFEGLERPEPTHS